MPKALDVRTLIQLYCESAEIAQNSGKEQVFKTTNKSSYALSEIDIPCDKEGFEDLVKNLFIILVEASGYSKRIPQDIDQTLLSKIKELRNHFEHDREQGTASEVKRKFSKIGDIYEFLIKKRYPAGNQDWIQAGSCLIHEAVDFLKKLKEYLTSSKEEKGSSLHEFFEHDITVFPSKKERFRVCKASKEISHGDSILLLPTFSYNSPAEFGDTKSAIHLTSEAQSADFNSFKDFLREIERLWTTDAYTDFSPASKLFPWSITVEGEVTYGSGSENLITVLEKRYEDIRAVVSIVLQGIFGEDNNHTFFIVIGSDIRGGAFTYNFLDFYLSSVPLDWNWINKFNNALDKLSVDNQKASSYVLKQYVYSKWESSAEIELKKGVIAGIGRTGYDQRREWDVFKALILKKTDLDIDFSLDDDSWKLSYERVDHPLKFLDEYTVSIPKVCYEEITKGELIGIRRPTVFMLGFEGKGWVIYALNIRAAWAKLKHE
ncbi:MAG: hypothetical protein NWE93_04740 [Candidatus Bathyarchaeota archaeon]|nr:hypothetical protein [Candidatus Bathyarchaeota archaeon]